MLGIYYMCGLAALLHAYFSYRDPLMRQRVRILTVGTLGAVIPFLIFKIGMEELSFRTGPDAPGRPAAGGHPDLVRLLRRALPGAADRRAAQAEPVLRPAVGR